MTQKRILCFGDSLTWGWIPTADGMPTERYPRHARWTGVLADRLGDDSKAYFGRNTPDIALGMAVLMVLRSAAKCAQDWVARVVTGSG